MKNIIPTIKNLITETEQIEIIRYKAAYEKFNVYNDFMFEEVSDGKLRWNNHREDWKYFKKLNSIFDETNSNDTSKTLEQLQAIEAPEGCISFYSDPYYTEIANNITKSTIELLNAIKIEEKEIEKEIEKDDELLKLLKLQQIQTKKLINREEVEVLFNISKSGLDNLRKRREPLPCLGGGSGGLLMFNKEAVEEWMMKHL